MSNIYSYGLLLNQDNKAVRENSLAYQELENLGFSDDEMYIDIVRNETKLRPELERLIKELKKGQPIDNDGDEISPENKHSENTPKDEKQVQMYSIAPLVMGKFPAGLYYYKELLQTGADIIIYDFSNQFMKLSKFSTINFDGSSKSIELLFKEFCNDLIELRKEVSRSGEYKRKRGNIISDIALEKDSKTGNAFKEIYFAYENYKIDLPTALNLLKKYCNIDNKSTFIQLISDYEKTRAYFSDFVKYANECPDILDLPKRSTPKLKEQGNDTANVSDIDNLISAFKQNGFDFSPKNICTMSLEERIKLVDDALQSTAYKKALTELRIITEKAIVRRWLLAVVKIPRPRKPIDTSFSIEEFENKYN